MAWMLDRISLLQLLKTTIRRNRSHFTELQLARNGFGDAAPKKQPKSFSIVSLASRASFTESDFYPSILYGRQCVYPLSGYLVLVSRETGRNSHSRRQRKLVAGANSARKPGFGFLIFYLLNPHPQQLATFFSTRGASPSSFTGHCGVSGITCLAHTDNRCAKYYLQWMFTRTGHVQHLQPTSTASSRSQSNNVCSAVHTLLIATYQQRKVLSPYFWCLASHPVEEPVFPSPSQTHTHKAGYCRSPLFKAIGGLAAPPHLRSSKRQVPWPGGFTPDSRSTLSTSCDGSGGAQPLRDRTSSF
ncbi:hypothetical protein B0T17DRAFT_511254 [Bombardia bombarda]|uniref:Uncharacterized protein n=1 Tax=Bombardia bombarda TaxID=252184 RepID=A0AA39WBQ9_9PEZI|nr:hypothetical protein B0T17DRAFT_511254 [Bombardia bombarda]